MGLHLLTMMRRGTQSHSPVPPLCDVATQSSEKAPIKGTACHGLSTGYYTHCAIHVPPVADDFQRMLALAKLKPLKGKSQPFDKQCWLITLKGYWSLNEGTAFVEKRKVRFYEKAHKQVI